MCNEQYLCIDPIELLCTTNRKSDGVLILLMIQCYITKESGTYNIEKLKDVIKQVAPLGVSLMKFMNHIWSDDYSFDNRAI